MVATFLHDGASIDYTPAAAVAAGDVIVQGELVGVAKTPIAADALGALAVTWRRGEVREGYVAETKDV